MLFVFAALGNKTRVSASTSDVKLAAPNGGWFIFRNCGFVVCAAEGAASGRVYPKILSDVQWGMQRSSDRSVVFDLCAAFAEGDGE